MEAKVTVLYGEMGSGKSYIGARRAKRDGAFFLEGDSAMPKKMAEAVSRFAALDQEVLDEFVHSHLYTAILMAVAHSDGDVVVAQALYRRRNRERLKEQLETAGLRAEFVHVKVPAWRNARQLMRRPSGWKWVLYWLKNKPFFEP